MSGLRARLENIDGVESIELELGDAGLEGITVRLTEGADEVEVLEGVRRLLVAYGTRPAGVSGAIASELAVSEGGFDSVSRFQSVDVLDTEDDFEDAEVGIVSHSNGDDPVDDVLGEPESDPEDVSLSIVPAGDPSVARVVYRRGERRFTRQVPSSARAIVQAVLDIASEVVAREPISVIGLNVSSIEGTRVLTVIAGNEGDTPKVSTVSVVDGNWSAALLQVASQILGEHPQGG